MSAEQAGPVIIHCPYHIAYEGEILLHPCRLLWGHESQCEPEEAPWGQRKRVSGGRPEQWAPDPVLWILNLSHHWPVLAHRVTGSEAEGDGKAAAHWTACGHRYTTRLTLGTYMTSVMTEGLLPLAEGSIHCGAAVPEQRADPGSFRHGL